VAPATPVPGGPLLGSTGGGPTDRGGPTGGGTASTGGRTVEPGPAVERGPVAAMVDAIVGVAEGAARVVRPEAVAGVAQTFSFPLALALVVVLFLLVQPRLDDRDPKLRTAPRSPADLLVGFEDDAQ
jgi:hypothetical protein